MASRRSRSEYLALHEGLEPIGKNLQAAGEVPAMRIEEIHRHGLGAVPAHDLNEFAGFEVAPDVIGRNLDEAEAGKAAAM